MTADSPNYLHTGLFPEAVERSRAEHGENLLTPPPRPSLWRLYLEKLEDPVVKVLLVAALCSLGIAVVENDYVETIGIVSAILLATGIGFYFEYDAGKKFDLLNAVSEESPVKVLRSGRVSEIARREVVVDDVVLLETGDEVPADGMLLDALSLQLNESSLTGEPVVSKTIHPEHFDSHATYPSNRVMRGSTVVNGHGRMRVEQVGDATEIGKVARQSMERTEEPTPLNRQLTRLANLIGKVGFTVAALAFLILFIKDVCLVYDFSSFHSLSDWLPALKETLQLEAAVAASHDRRDPRSGGRTRRAPPDHLPQSGAQHAADAHHQQLGAQDARLRDDGGRHRHLYRQDRHLDTKPYAGASHLLPLGFYRPLDSVGSRGD